MVVIKPEPIHITIQSNSEGLRAVILGRSQWWKKLLAFVPVLWTLPFFTGWGVAALAVVGIATNGILRGDLNFVISLLVFVGAFLGIYLLFVIFYLRSAWWGFSAQLLRTEVLAVGRLQWCVCRDYGLWQSSRQYELARITASYLADDRPKRHWPGGVLPISSPPGRLEFAYGRQGVTFASSATEAEAEHLLATIHRAFPQLQLPPTPAERRQSTLPEAPHWRLHKEFGILKLTLPVRRRWKSIAQMVYNVLFFSAWTGWFWILAPAVGPWPNQALPLFLVLGALGAYLLLWSWRELLWEIRGVEVVEWSSGGLRLSGIHLCFPQPHQYMGECLTGLGTSNKIANFAISPGVWRRPGDTGHISFNYGAATYRFGESLTPAEAEELVQQILAQFPQYGREGLIGPLAEPAPL